MSNYYAADQIGTVYRFTANRWQKFLAEVAAEKRPQPGDFASVAHCLAHENITRMTPKAAIDLLSESLVQEARNNGAGEGPASEAEAEQIVAEAPSHES